MEINYIYTLIGLGLFIVLSVLVYCIYMRKSMAKVVKGVLEDQILFDENYVKERQNITGLPSNIHFPLKAEEKGSFDDLLGKQVSEKWDWFEELEDMKYNKIADDKYTFYNSIIVSLFKDLKDLDSKVSQAFFKKRMTVLQYKNHDKGPELLEKVKNIISSVDSYKYLSENELIKINQYLYQIYIDYLMNGSSKKVAKFKKILESYLSTDHIEEAFKSMWLPVPNFEYALLFYEAIASELEVCVKVYDYRQDVSSSNLKGAIKFNNKKDTTITVVATSEDKYLAFHKIQKQ